MSKGDENMEEREGKFVPLSEYLVTYASEEERIEAGKPVEAVLLRYLQKHVDPDVTSAKKWLNRDDTPNYAIVGPDTVAGFARSFDDAVLMGQAIAAASSHYDTVCVFGRDGIVDGSSYERKGRVNATNSLENWAAGMFYEDWGVT